MLKKTKQNKKNPSDYSLLGAARPSIESENTATDPVSN